MTKRRICLILVCTVAALFIAWLWRGQRGTVPAIEESERVDRIPQIRPEYVGTVIPPNIAPLNFLIEESGTAYCVKIRSTQGKGIEVFSRTPQIDIPLRPWKRLLSLNRGRELYFDIFAKQTGGRWRRFDTLTNTIAREDIDGYLVYRLIGPLHHFWLRDVNIYQRNIQDYKESVVLDNRSVGFSCLNCHTFHNNRPDRMVFQVRGGPETAGMILVRDGAVIKVDTRTRHSPASAAHFAWHPSGRIAAFSLNKLMMFTHAVGEIRDVWDAASDLALYVVDSNRVTSTKKIAHPNRLETWPTWSPDGEYLYFCSAPPTPQSRYKEIKYDLMRIRYDLETGVWGDPETVLAAQETGLSIAQPRISPDGRFLLFCMSECGSFPVFLDSSDLYMMDIKTGTYRRLEINSDLCESWHSWSSNSRWIVFSSKRLDGLLAKVYFSYVDENGKAHKPLLLPQKDPRFYDSLVRTYNLPELIVEPIRIPPRDFCRAVYASPQPVSSDAVTGPTPAADAAQQPSPARERGLYGHQ